MPSISFAEERIADAEIVKGSLGGPVFSTQINKTYGGFEQRNALWDESLWEGELGQRTLRQIQWNTLNAFFRARFGRLIGFRHKDWTDYTVAKSEGTLTPINGQANAYQLYKTYTTAGGVTFNRKIVKPVQGKVIVWRADTNIAISATVDYTTGIVTLAAPAPAALYWTGEFDVPVRFDVDKLQSNFAAYDPASREILVNVASVPIVGLQL